MNLTPLSAFRSGPGTFSGWTYGVLAVVMGFLSFVCLMREETIKVSATVGDYWLDRINGRKRSPSTPSAVSHEALQGEPESAL